MPQDATDRRVRVGTKSCIECRRRKIRCIWSSNRNGAGGNERTACEYCLNRGRACIPQPQRAQVSGGTHVTARDRMSHLEQEVASLAAIVRDRGAPSSNATRPDESSAASGGLGNEHEQDHVELEDTSPPAHLRLLFDNLAMSPSKNEYGNRQSSKPFRNFIQMARAKLRPLVPSYDEISRIAQYASSWMTLYHSLFPAFFAPRIGDQLIVSCNQMREDDEVHPVALAMYLLFVAITIQQVPVQNIPVTFNGGHGVTKFVGGVCRAVEHNIIGNNALVATTEGLETAMLYVRLWSLGRGDLKGTWLTSRRIIALAELIGLPRANYELDRMLRTQDRSGQAQADQEALKVKADVWETICTTDRNFSMMLNLPAGNYQLSNVCATVFDIDESYLREVSHAESYEKVLSADRQLRALAASVPKIWWHDTEDMSIEKLLVKFWHYYIMARVHLRPGMMNDFNEQYAYSRTACLDACHNGVRLFPRFRSRIPSGFFVCQVLDVQVFTAATFLLLASRSTQRTQQSSRTPDTASTIVGLVQCVVDCFASVSDQAGSDLAREAMAALTSLIKLVQGHGPGQSEPLTLQIPLLGNIRIRRPDVTAASQNVSEEMAVISTPSLEVPEELSSGSLSLESKAQDAITAQDSSVSWSYGANGSLWWSDGILMPNDIVGIDHWFGAEDVET